MPTIDSSTPNWLRQRADWSLTRFLCRALRHTPNQFGLTLDANGWTELDPLIVVARRCRPEWALLDRRCLEQLIAASHHDRLEISEGRIRALYGHSVPNVQTGTPGIPPNPLFHGTKACWLREILSYGLRPMGRTFVHLTTDFKYAKRVAENSHSEAAVLVIDSDAALKQGVQFLRASCQVWQAPTIPTACITPK